MGVLRPLFELFVVLAAIAQVVGWLLLFLLNSYQGKVEDRIRARVSQPEYYLIKWEEDPSWARIQKIKNYIFPTILITGAFLLLVGFILNAIDSEGSCYGRFEDYCTGFE